MTFEEIDAQRRRIGVSVPELCRRAKVNYSTWWRATTGRKSPRPSTLVRLRRGLNAPASPRRPRDNATLILTTFRGYAAHFAILLGADPAIALASEPGKRSNASPAWRLAAEVRELAVYCTVVELDLRGAPVARAIGVTKAAVSQMLRRVEDDRSDPKVDAMVEAAGRLISGRIG